MQVFVDMDGVLADFDQHHEDTFGYRSDKLLDNVNWASIAGVPNFYANIPPMKDLPVLWRYIADFEPIVLTGVPYSVPEAPENKKSWVRKNLGPHVEVRCCPSKEKYKHATPGDLLIDDWEKYRNLWVQAGGVWITHTSAEETVGQLRRLGF
jgi:hypothetical protein